MILTDREVRLLQIIFADCAAWEYIDHDNEECEYRELYEKVVSVDTSIVYNTDTMDEGND